LPFDHGGGVCPAGADGLGNAHEPEILVSIVIPTLNEGATLPVCLEAVLVQSYQAFEVLVVDSGSDDGTRDAALSRGAKLLDYPGKPMGARREGFRHAKGEIVLFLDGDQVLQGGTLERVAKAMASADMLILEEGSYRPHGFLQRSISRQREAIHLAYREGELAPHLYPRVYRRWLLEKAYAGITEERIGGIFVFDDALLFRKAYALSQKVRLLDKAVLHMEDDNWLTFMKGAYRAGRSRRSVDLGELEGDPGREEGAIPWLQRAAKSRSLTMMLVKLFFFRLGALGS
jgi:glycosyltransferase involved in cell wall biosynthesis